jgi:cytochrome b
VPRGGAAEARDGIGSARQARAQVRAWDLPTRLFKWGLVLLVLVGWLTHLRGDDGLVWHMWNGIAVLVLIVFRLLWGIVGSSTARFDRWLSTPWRAVGYGVALMSGRAGRYLGHNPLGAWMILALLAAAGAQAFSGLFMVDSNGINGGPFANTDPSADPTPAQAFATSVHVRGILVIAALVALHVLVNLAYQFLKREPLIQAMVTGVTPAADYADEAAMRPAPALWLRAALCLAAAAAIVIGGIKLFGGTLPG